MSNLQSPAAPTGTFSQTTSKHYRSFVDHVQIEHGPGGILGRMFLSGERSLREQGLSLVFGTFDDMARVNEHNFATWGPLVPLFDSRHAQVPNETAFCLFAIDEHGEIVACQAARLFHLVDTDLRTQVELGALFYPLGEPPADERYSLDVPEANQISGKITYSGGLWVHPSARGKQLGSILPRISRAYAYGLWNSDYTLSFARNALVSKGMIERYGYPHMGQPFRRHTLGKLDFDGVVVWMSRAELLADTEAVTSSLNSQIDRTIGSSRYHSKSPTV